MDKTAYQSTTKKMTRTGGSRLCYVICGEDTPGLLEMHHVDGRAISGKTVPLCKNCHAKVTMEQNRFPPTARAADAVQSEQIAYWLLSLGALLNYIGQSLIEFAHEVQQHGNHGGARLHTKVK
jgi:hypothetical protein